MRGYKQLATRIAIVAASAALLTSSAFADSRHQNWTRGRAAKHERERHERTAPQPQSHRSYGFGHHDAYRGGDHGNRGHHNGYYYAPHASYYHSGRISHYEPWHGGYRVYVAGAPFPFFVPFAHWDPFRFRIGLTIGLGGYYNPAGYYDYYGYAPPPPYYSGRVVAPAPAPASNAVIRGTVESVDYRALTFVLRNEQTGNYITVDNGGRENRDVRPGDYVEVQGTWNGNYLTAYNVAYLGAPAYPNGQYPR